jgi:phosphoserine phosphatase
VELSDLGPKTGLEIPIGALADAVARELAFEDVLANRFEVDAHGACTGKTLGRLLRPREARGR